MIRQPNRLSCLLITVLLQPIIQSYVMKGHELNKFGTCHMSLHHMNLFINMWGFTKVNKIIICLLLIMICDCSLGSCSDPVKGSQTKEVRCDYLKWVLTT